MSQRRRLRTVIGITILCLVAIIASWLSVWLQLRATLLEHLGPGARISYLFAQSYTFNTAIARVSYRIYGDCIGECYCEFEGTVIFMRAVGGWRILHEDIIPGICSDLIERQGTSRLQATEQDGKNGLLVAPAHRFALARDGYNNNQGENPVTTSLCIESDAPNHALRSAGSPGFTGWGLHLRGQPQVLLPQILTVADCAPVASKSELGVAKQEMSPKKTLGLSPAYRLQES